MSEFIEVYGTKIKLPEKPCEEEIINYNEERKSQRWERKELPSFFDKVEYDKKGNLVLTQKQEEFANTEVSRCKKGVWYRIGGKDRFITGKYYFFLQYYLLEDGTFPEFREADRLYFLFHNHWYNIDWALGNIRIKKRRQGASSQSCSNILYEAIFYKNSNCGLISKTKEDSKDTFTQMVTAAYRQLPAFLKPKQVNKEDSVTELVFAHKATNAKEGIFDAQKSEEGHNSRINYKAPVLNAYDRGRMSFVLGDEFGKLPQDVPASRLLAIISKTLVKGVKKVGWIDMPSTVNEMTKGGGAEYKKIWDSANQFAKHPTTNRIVRFFQPAYESYEGFIDEFGDSVIDTPTEEQFDYLVKKWVRYDDEDNVVSELSEEDIKLGAKRYVLVKLRADKTGEDLEEEIRMNPCTEQEAFLYAGIGCEFDSIAIQKRIQELEENPPLLRKWRLQIKKDTKKDLYGKDIVKDIVVPMEDEKTGWLIFEKPNIENNFREYAGQIEPLNCLNYQIGVDTTQDRIAENGSNPCILVFKKSCKINVGGELQEMGMYTVAMWVSPTRLDIHFDEEVLKACMWYGCRANYENDRRVDWINYFRKKDAARFLDWTPKIFQNPNKRGGFKPEMGSRSGDGYQLSQQLSIAKMYIDGDDIENYNGYVHKISFITLLKELMAYDHSDRTKSDQVVALMMALAPVIGEMQNPIIPTNVTRELFPTYVLKMA